MALVDEVDLTQVSALLLARAPQVLDPDSADHGLYLALVAGIAAEVVAITGPEPTDAEYRALAVQTIAVGAAAQLEFALFPEQQLGDGARGQQLQARYEALLARLGASPHAAGDTPGTAVPAPQGSFPDPLPYPDPAGLPTTYDGVVYGTRVVW